MADKIKELLGKVLEWWNHFSTKQKMFIISAGAGVILALAILVTVLTRPQYTLLRNCDARRKLPRLRSFWRVRDLITRFQMMPIRLPSIRSSFPRRICCLLLTIFRQIPIQSIM